MKLSDIIKVFAYATLVVLGIALLNMLSITGNILGESNEALCPTHVIEQFVCDVSVDCCCPTETPTPTETIVPFSTPTKQVTTTKSAETVIPSSTSTSVPKRTATNTLRPSSTPSTCPTVTYAPPTETIPVPAVPTETVVECKCVWVCWSFNEAKGYWKNYCCPLGDNHCVESHMKQGDSYMSRCQHGEETHPDDGYCLED